MNILKPTLVLGLALMVSGCGEAVTEGLLSGGIGPNKAADRGTDSDDLTGLQAGIWVDPNGCDHWIIDDGVEGYLSSRLDKYGKPVCSGSAPPTYIRGDFKQGSTSIIGDPL